MAFVQSSSVTSSCSTAKPRPLFRKLPATHKASQRLFAIKQKALAKLESRDLIPIDFEELREHARQYDYHRKYSDYKRKHRLKQLHFDHQQQSEGLLLRAMNKQNPRRELLNRSKEFSERVRDSHSVTSVLKHSFTPKKCGNLRELGKLQQTSGDIHRSRSAARTFERTAAKYEMKLEHSQGLRAVEFSRRASEAYISSIRSKLVALQSLT